jgi:hypothetical protein
MSFLLTLPRQCRDRLDQSGMCEGLQIMALKRAMRLLIAALPHIMAVE